MCGYALVCGSVHADAYALALTRITGVEIKKMRPTCEQHAEQDPWVPEILE